MPTIMPRRRFGRTELQMPVFSCGGMRYNEKWGEFDPATISPESQANSDATIQRALELGINHIETARGYGSSEYQLGRLLPTLDREKLIVQTKVNPQADPKEFEAIFEKSMSFLKLDYVDLLGFHGVNTLEVLDWVIRPGGCLEVARKWQKEGRVRFTGFSTHGTCATIAKACETGEFDYVNLHWYFVNDLNWGAVEAATRQDMGVFIISPNDKGGKLYEAPPKMTELCQPLTPMQFNDLYCLARPQVHTLSIGAAKPGDFDEHIAGLEKYDKAAQTIAPIEKRLRAEMESVLGREWLENWFRGVPEHHDLPGDVNVLEILRLYTYAKSLDLVEWGKMRYNLLGNAGHWFPGQHIGALDDENWVQLAAKLEKNAVAAQIPAALREAHEMLLGEEKKRLSAS